MRRLICSLLAAVLTISAVIPVCASETEEWYGTIAVEYSDSYGKIENLNVMVKDGHVYADVFALSSRLGYNCEQNGDLISVSGGSGLFVKGSPYLAVHFKIGENIVAYNPLCGIEQEYVSPTTCIQNNHGTWVSLKHTLLLLGASCNVFDDEFIEVSEDVLVIQMPRNNVLSVAAAIVNNDSFLSFDWVEDFCYSEVTTNVTDGAARVVTLFNGLLKFDGAAWLSLVCWDAFDLKFGKMMTQMLCTYSSEEMRESIKEVEIMLEPFDPNGTLGQILRNKQIRVNSDWTYWDSTCADYLKKLEAGCGSPAKYNYLYQQCEKAMDAQMLFSAAGENLIYIQDELSSATNFLEITSKIGSALTYWSEFQSKDAFLSSALKGYLSTRMETDKMSSPMTLSMNTYLKTIDWGSASYTATWFILEQLPELIMDKSGLDVLLGAPASLALFAWDIMSETIPFYKEGLSSVENREISNYAQMLQNDALLNLTSLLNSMQASSEPINRSQCVQLAKYCYVYLKACYLSRETAIKSLNSISEKSKKKIEGKINSEMDVNQKIAEYLAILSGADESNQFYSLGFLDEDNKQFCNQYNDSTLLNIVQEHVETVVPSTANNGGLAVRKDNELYYWVASDSSVPTYTLVCSDGNKITKKLYSGPHRGEIFILNDVVYVNQIDVNYNRWVTAMNLTDGSSEMMEKMEVLGVDEVTSSVFLHKGWQDWNDNGSIHHEYYLYRQASASLERLSDIGFIEKVLASGNGYSVWSQHTDDYKGIQIMRCDHADSSIMGLATIYPDRDEYNSYTCIGFQETDYAYYVAGGCIAGSGNYYQGDSGKLIRIDKSDFSTDLIIDNWSASYETYGDYSPEFYVFSDNGNEYVLHNKGDGVQMLNVSTGESEKSDMPLRTAGEAFSTFSESEGITQFWIYPDDSGSTQRILPNFNLNTYDPSNGEVYIRNVEYTGNFVFYDMVYYEANPNPTSWRDHTIESHRETYLYDCSTGEQWLISPIDLLLSTSE